MMNKIVKKTGFFLLNIHDCLCDGCAYVAAWMIFGMTLSIGYEVIVRYFFLRPTTWVSDFTDYALVYTTFLVSAWLLKHQEHIRLTILLDILPPRPRLVMETISSLVGAIVCGFLIWYGVRDSWDALEQGIFIPRPLPVPKYLILMVIPFGCFLFLVQFVKNAVKSLSTLKNSQTDN